MKIKILPYPLSYGGKPYEHLEPIVDALIEAGNKPTQSSRFYQARDGWRCDLKKPIDFKLLKERFEFPESIILSEPLDKIFCQNSWVEIKGNVK